MTGCLIHNLENALMQLQFIIQVGDSNSYIHLCDDNVTTRGSRLPPSAPQTQRSRPTCANAHIDEALESPLRMLATHSRTLPFFANPSQKDPISDAELRAHLSQSRNWLVISCNAWCKAIGRGRGRTDSGRRRGEGSSYLKRRPPPVRAAASFDFSTCAATEWGWGEARVTVDTVVCWHDYNERVLRGESRWLRISRARAYVILCVVPTGAAGRAAASGIWTYELDWYVQFRSILKEYRFLSRE